jgi:hypothetical protein
MPPDALSKTVLIPQEELLRATGVVGTRLIKAVTAVRALSQVPFLMAT